jgi:hypothetical protein
VPKLLVLIDATETESQALSAAVVEGANAVRFTETDVRSVVAGVGLRNVTSVHELSGYDAIIVAAPASVSAELSAFVAGLGAIPAPANLVIGLASESAALTASAARIGAILMTERQVGAEGARTLGRRVAKLIAWVRHGLGHEAESATDVHSHGGHGHAHHHEPHAH